MAKTVQLTAQVETTTLQLAVNGLPGGSGDAVAYSSASSSVMLANVSLAGDIEYKIASGPWLGLENGAGIRLNIDFSAVTLYLRRVSFDGGLTYVELSIDSALPSGGGGGGTNGKTVLSGTAAPSSGIGTVGDFYINTATSIIYGPKTSSGWPTGVSLIGNDGQSAYQLAVAAGFVGTIVQWIASLKGEKGDPGTGSGGETYSVLGLTSVSTSATPTAGAFTAFPAGACNGLIIENPTADAIEYQRNGAGALHEISAFERKPVYGITDASQIAIRRKDYATARTSQVIAVNAQLINTSATYSVTNLIVTTANNSGYSSFGSFACAALEVSNKGTKDVYVKHTSSAVSTDRILLRTGESRMFSGITNANQISCSTFDGVSAQRIVAEAFQAMPGLPRRTYILADAISPTASMMLGEGNAGSQYNPIVATPAMIGQRTPWNLRGKLIGACRTTANTIFTPALNSGNPVANIADVALPSGDTFAPATQQSSQVTAPTITWTIGGSVQVLPAAAECAKVPIDVTDSALHYIVQRNGTTGSLTSIVLDIFSDGTPDAPSANYHRFSAPTPGGGLSPSNGFGALAAPISRFVAVGSGATLTAIKYFRYVFVGTNGLVLRVGQVKVVKNVSSKLSVQFSFDDLFTSPQSIGKQMLGPYGWPAMLFPSAASSTGNYNQIAIDNMLALQHMEGWQICSQDWLGDGGIDRTADGWLLSMQKQFILGAALGFHQDGLKFGSYYGNGPYYTSAEQKKRATSIFAGMREFYNGAGTLGDGIVPGIPDTNPPANPWSMAALNINAYGSTAGNEDAIFAKFKLYIDLAFSYKGIVHFAGHNDLANPVLQTVFQMILDYIKPMVDAGTAEVVTDIQLRKRQAIN